ncbi:MAG: hypothetical protein HC907_15000 [Richelia sp. SM1_7_0]|nr:hypothetical protein [Richelia sp. SM1_7_0]
MAEILTPGGLQGVHLITADTFLDMDAGIPASIKSNYKNSNRPLTKYQNNQVLLID